MSSKYLLLYSKQLELQKKEKLKELMNGNNNIDIVKYVSENNDKMVCDILSNDSDYLFKIPSEMRKEEYILCAMSERLYIFCDLDDNDKTSRVCEIAVKAMPRLMENVPEHIKTEEFIYKMIDEEGYVIHYIDNPTEEMYLRALITCPNAIFSIKNPTEKMMTLACKAQGLYNNWRNMPQYYNAVLAYVKIFGASLKHIRRKFKTYEVCKAAIENSRYAIKFVNKSTLRKHPDLLELASKKWDK